MENKLLGWISTVSAFKTSLDLTSDGIFGQDIFRGAVSFSQICVCVCFTVVTCCLIIMKCEFSNEFSYHMTDVGEN